MVSQDDRRPFHGADSRHGYKKRSSLLSLLEAIVLAITIDTPVAALRQLFSVSFTSCSCVAAFLPISASRLERISRLSVRCVLVYIQAAGMQRRTRLIMYTGRLAYLSCSYQ